MKKVGVILLVVVGMLAGAAVQQAYAQDKKVEFSLNLGVMSYLGSGESFADVLLAISPQVDIHVTRGFMISPEAMVITNFRFSGLIGFPGVIFNYVGKGFFIGAGVVLPVYVSAEDAGVGTILPKLNIGYRGKKINLTAFLIDQHPGHVQR